MKQLIILLTICSLSVHGSEDLETRYLFVGESDSCDFELTYANISLICHSAARPAVRLGTGQFIAQDNLGNFELNDTVSEVIDLSEYEITDSDTFAFRNSEKGLGINLKVFQDNDLGLFEIALEYPDQYAQNMMDINRIWLDIVAEPNEFVYGGGEQYTFLNLRGRNYPIWVREQGVGRNKSSTLTQLMDMYSKGGGDYHTTYWPQPSFISSRKFYFESSFPTYSELDFTLEDRHTLYWHLTTPHNGEPGGTCLECRLSFLVKNSLMDIVTALNPGQPELPDWVYNGAILGVQGGTDAMLDYLDMADGQGVQVSGMWIQDWSGKITTEFGTRVFWNWEWNSTWYPDLDTLVPYLDQNRNVKVTVYITAHLNTDGDVYKSAEEEEYWLNTDEGVRLVQDFGEFSVATVDIHHQPPDCNCINVARGWYKDLMKKNLIDFGFAGWMADFGEYTPMEARTKFAERWWKSQHGQILHQTYPQEWARLNREVVEESGKLGEIMYWMRSGGLSSKDSQVMSWAGDQTVDWTRSDGLPSSIVSALSLSLSGMGLTHSDIGGYTTIGQLGVTRTKELFLRWAEYAAFTPVMRTHEGNQPEVNHQFYTDKDTLQQFGRLTQIYVALSNYTREAVRQNAEDHVPVMRPLFLMFENDPETYSVEYEYMLGDDLLVAPVLEPAVDTWTVYLPAGSETWVHLWTLMEHESGQSVSVSADLGNPPVFFRKSSKWSQLFQSISEKFPLLL